MAENLFIKLIYLVTKNTNKIKLKSIMFVLFNIFWLFKISQSVISINARTEYQVKLLLER